MLAIFFVNIYSTMLMFTLELGYKYVINDVIKNYV